MYTFRNCVLEDFNTISTFPLNKAELFYMFPGGVFPLEPKQIYEASLTRLLPTVVECDQELTGYSNLYDLVEDSHCFIGNVIISPQFRGRGAGKYLIDVMTERARDELKVKEVHLVCHNTNIRALLLYNKIGFKPYDLKSMRDYDNNEVMGILMKKKL